MSVNRNTWTSLLGRLRLSMRRSAPLWSSCLEGVASWSRQGCWSKDKPCTGTDEDLHSLNSRQSSPPEYIELTQKRTEFRSSLKNETERDWNVSCIGYHTACLKVINTRSTQAGAIGATANLRNVAVRAERGKRRPQQSLLQFQKLHRPLVSCNICLQFFCSKHSTMHMENQI